MEPCKPSGNWSDTLHDPPQENDIAVLSRDQAEQLFGPRVSRPGRVTPLRVVGLQILLCVVAMSFAWLWSSRAAVSAGIGGLICWAPGAVFAIGLKCCNDQASVVALVIGEAVKIAMTIALFIAVAICYPAVSWVPLLLTYLLCLKSYWIAFALH